MDINTEVALTKKTVNNKFKPVPIINGVSDEEFILSISPIRADTEIKVQDKIYKVNFNALIGIFRNLSLRYGPLVVQGYLAEILSIKIEEAKELLANFKIN